jgi:hypothetical protein
MRQVARHFLSAGSPDIGSFACASFPVPSVTNVGCGDNLDTSEALGVSPHTDLFTNFQASEGLRENGYGNTCT